MYIVPTNNNCTTKALCHNVSADSSAYWLWINEYKIHEVIIFAVFLTIEVVLFFLTLSWRIQTLLLVKPEEQTEFQSRGTIPVSFVLKLTCSYFSSFCMETMWKNSVGYDCYCLIICAYLGWKGEVDCCTVKLQLKNYMTTNCYNKNNRSDDTFLNIVDSVIVWYWDTSLCIIVLILLRQDSIKIILIFC